MPKSACFLFLGTFILFSCSKKEDRKLFEEQTAASTGIDFENRVVQNENNHVLVYPYYFNGGGVAVGDINNDGLEDVYFSGNMVANKLYLNKGNFQFEDITTSAGVAVAEGWKTGVTLVDINQDGLLDIYVCRSAAPDSTLRKNLLFINNGNLTFTNKAEEYGIADNAYSTQASFFDYDKDGDLDMFVLNHSIPKYAGFSNMLINLKKQKSTSYQSKIYQQDNGKFKDVSDYAGIVNNVLSFGLGVAVGDTNQDGWPDIYISNDFNEEDYLYINNQDGTFKNITREAIGHVSLFSMGSDIADVNNDALPDIMTLDMMPESNERIKLSSGDDNYDKYSILIKSGFHHQSMRNMLQLNNGNGTFSEVGQLMGISNTDWSWSTLFADFDGDGWKDLFVSNGYEEDYTNMQFLKFTVDEQLKSQRTGKKPDINTIIAQMHPIQVGNVVFRNNGDLTFTKKTTEWGISRAFKSNGAAYADLDNDGDLDLVINTMNEKAVLYKNNSADDKKANFLKIDLRKANSKHIIEGTKVIVYRNDTIQYQEFSPVRGFQSAMHVPLIFGLKSNTTVDSIRIIWPDNKTQLLKDIRNESVLTPRYEDASAIYKYPSTVKPILTEDHTLNWTQHAVSTNDFKRQILLPKMLSYSGPRMAKGDVNKDGLEDIYICAPKHQPGVLFVQENNGSFLEKTNQSFIMDKDYQDEDATFVDVDNDGDLDLYVVSGGYLFTEKDLLLQDRLYLNDGRGTFTRVVNSIPAETLAGSCVVPLDVDGDKDIDLFVGTRLTPGAYPIPSPSMFLINDGKGNFVNDVGKISSVLENSGMVCDALATDLNKDGAMDLVVTGEWMKTKIFINVNRLLVDETAKWMPPSSSGWWNCVLAADVDNDGDPDLIAGNFGLNNQFGVSPAHPATLVYKDFNQDGQVDPFLCYYIGDKSFPYASRDEALGQVGVLRGRFPDYTSYSTATIETIFKKPELENAITLQAEELRTVLFENVGGRFELRQLPVQAQFSPVYAIASADIDRDGDTDLILGGNETMTRVRIGKSDANKGMLLLNDGKGHFSYVSQAISGLNLEGDVRDLVIVESKDATRLIVGETGKPVRSYWLKK